VLSLIIVVLKEPKMTKRITKRDNFIIKIDDDKEKIKQFPRDLRLNICLSIYKFLKQNSLLSDNLILNKIFQEINSYVDFPFLIKEIKERLQNSHFKNALIAYVLDLIKIIRKLLDLNENKKKFSLKDLTKFCLENTTLGLSQTYLREFIQELLKKLRESYDDFNPQYKKELTYMDLLKIAKDFDGYLLTTEETFNEVKGYISHTKFLWQCKEKHKPFKRSPAEIIQNRLWCPHKTCSPNKKKSWTYKRLQQLAEQRGLQKNGVSGKLITSRKEYNEKKKKKSPNRTKYLWSCKIDSHKPWRARPDSIDSGGTWCPYCASNAPLQYIDMIKLARDAGVESTGKPGRFLTPENFFNKISLKSKYQFLWQCGEKHKPWFATESNIKLGRWCPECAQGTSERVARYLCECIFKASFPKSRPKWIEKLTGHKLHLDGHNKRLALAFELNGIQHYEPVYGYKKLLIQQELDSLKKWACEKKSITLIIIPYNFDGQKDFVNYDKMQNFIISEYERMTGEKLPKQPKYDYRTRDIKRLDEF
jgi:hypothetical protein